MSQDFNGKVVIITGGASGMGAATAGLFAESGAKVFIIDRNAELAGKTAAALGVEAITGDVSQSAFCEAAIARAAAGGRVDALVNAAGIIVRATGLDTSDEDWQRTLNVNVLSLIHISEPTRPY